MKSEDDFNKPQIPVIDLHIDGIWTDFNEYAQAMGIDRPHQDSPIISTRADLHYPKILYLDMDGVILNFADALRQYLNLKPYHMQILVDRQIWKPNDYDICRAFFSIPELKGKPFTKHYHARKEEYLKSTDTFLASLPYSFWISIKKYPWADELINLIKTVMPDFKIVLCTAILPTQSAHSARLAILTKYFADFPFIFTQDKHLLAKYNTILIDDFQNNITNFNVAGGYGITFPQYWNDYHSFDANIYHDRPTVSDYKRNKMASIKIQLLKYRQQVLPKLLPNMTFLKGETF
jgi:hypothetical protein